MKCPKCGNEETNVTQMPEGYIHHAKMICRACGYWGWLKRPKERYNLEKDFVDEIEIFLKDNGYEVWREVNPDNSKLRIDLIFNHQDHGLIALEAKNLKSIRQGAVIAKAIDQIKGYERLTFFNGKKIDKWCLSFPSDKSSYWGSKEVKRHVEEFLLYFLKHYNINLLFYKKYSNENYNKILISPLTPDSIKISKQRGEDKL